jgi:hypothetical protein
LLVDWESAPGKLGADFFIAQPQPRAEGFCVMKLSLSVITGNAEKYVERFLDSFQPFFDEVVMVRATGKQDFDRTLEIASARGCRVEEYYNDRSKDSSHWDHVDDFAAARNQSLDLCTGDWVMWADMDDLLENGHLIREELESMPDDATVLGVPYDVREDKIRIMRERIWKRGTARWKNPIHEELELAPETIACETQRWQIIHAPTGTRGANDERNLRILESISEPSGSQRFHMFQSLRAVGRIEDAVRLAMELIRERPKDLGDVEIYELLMATGQLTTGDQRGQIILQAVGLDPRRREALGEMAIFEMGSGRPEKAEAWLNAMESLKYPNPLPWNTRRMFYEWIAPHLRGMALRMQGRVHEADTIETNHVIRNGARISLLHATRGRPHQAAACRRVWFERAKNPDSIEHIFGLDADDETAMSLSCHRAVWVNEPMGGSVAAWNKCAEASIGQVLVQLSDDWNPPLHWDEKIWDEFFRNIPGHEDEICYAIPGKISAVLAVNDGFRKDDLLCMAILTRKRYQDQGYMFHPDFFSVYSDDWFSHCAFRDGVVIDARERITFEHMHPAFGKGEMDATYSRGNCKAAYERGKEVLDKLINQ